MGCAALIVLCGLSLASCDLLGSGRAWGTADAWGPFPEERPGLCRRSPPRPFEPGSTTVLRQVEDFPCVIGELPEGVFLSAGESDMHPDPVWVSMRRSARTGEYYTGAGAGHQEKVLRWDADGEFLGHYGTEGEGPGEFTAIGSLGIFLGPGDSVYVRDGRHQWTVLSRELEFGRGFQGLQAGRMPRSMHVLPGGEIVTTGRVVEGLGEHTIHVMDGEGEFVRSFGELTGREAPAGVMAMNLNRPSALSGDGTLWVASPDGTRGALALEHWDLEGRLLRRIVRDVAWWPSEGFGTPADELDSYAPHFLFLEVDLEGLLWYAVGVRSREWEPPTTSEREGEGGYRRRQARRSELYDVRVEVVDPVAGEVLASTLIPETVPDDRPFRGTVPGDRHRYFYRVSQDSLGFSAIELFQVRLYSRQ